MLTLIIESVYAPTHNFKSNGYISTLLDDASFHPQGKLLQDNDPNLRDPRASNGIVHTINRVLIPSEITQGHY